MSRAAYCFLVLVNGLLAAANARGQEVLFDGGPTLFASGLEMSQFLEADDFVVVPGGTVTGVRFWTLEGYGIRPGSLPFDGHIDYAFYLSENGTPAASPLFGGVATVLSRQQLGVQATFGLFKYEYVLGFPTPLEATSNQQYFLALHFLDEYPGPVGEFYWAVAEGPQRLSSSHGRYLGNPPWYRNSQSEWLIYNAGRFAYQILGTPAPEPASSLMMVGALALGVTHRRTRTQTI